jgi:hypothetical protein
VGFDVRHESFLKMDIKKGQQKPPFVIELMINELMGTASSNVSYKVQ